ncbi:MAG: DMT family transporter [candidate division Zixibacteria bacterium]|nr:DMT family transporter [candidate division Zixibacteria bacterium]
MPVTERMKGDLWAIVSAVTTGCGLIASKVVLRTLDPLTLNAYAFFFGSMVVLGEAVISGNLAATFRVTFRQLLFLTLLAFLFCGSLFCLMNALNLVEPATVSFLSRLELVITLILAGFFLRERISIAETIGLAVVVIGILVMRYDASVALSKAMALVVISAILSGISEVITKSRIDWIDFRAFVFYRNAIMTVLFIAAGLISGRLVWVTDYKLVLLMAVVGFFMPYWGRLGYLKAMRYIKISRAVIIVQCQPFLTAALALLILGTLPPVREMAGGLLIVGGIVLMRLLENRAVRETN